MKSQAVMIEPYSSDRLSKFRTFHDFEHFSLATTVEQVMALQNWARNSELPMYFVGAGSNLLFTRRKVKSLVVRNMIPNGITHVSGDRFRVSSSTSISRLLKTMHQENRACAYYLASVPATVGGAIAMNAGRGRQFGVSILDFVEEVDFVQNGVQATLSRNELQSDYRYTIFTGKSDRVITSAVMRCPKTNIIGSPISERVRYSKENQDHSSSNCGSVFKLYNSRIMEQMQRRGFTIAGASWSKKTLNWIINDSARSDGIRILILIAKMLHKMAGKRAALELIEIS